jgi:hypothetical protein
VHTCRRASFYNKATIPLIHEISVCVKEATMQKSEGRVVLAEQTASAKVLRQRQIGIFGEIGLARAAGRII